MCVRGDLLRSAVVLVTLRARSISVHAMGQLIVGPVAYTARIVFRFVHRVAVEAVEFARLETRRVQQAVVFASRNSHHAVGPKRIVYEAGIFLKNRLQLRRVGIGIRLIRDAMCM